MLRLSGCLKYTLPYVAPVGWYIITSRQSL